MPGPKPKLEVATPLTSNFPSEITSAASLTSINTATPLSGLGRPPVLCKVEPDFVRTPITPPAAYADFLTKAMPSNSPAVSPVVVTAESTALNSSSPAADASEKADDSSISSASSASVKDNGSASTSPATSTACSTKSSSPTSATTPSASEKASAVERALALASASLVPPSPFTKAPMSAPPTGPTSFPSFMLPPSPAISNLDSPLSAVPLSAAPMSAVSSLLSPYSGRTARSVFDWDAALRAHYADQRRTRSRTSVRNIREVVTRTVTYTPRMEPAPRGKRRKVE
ncbi:uncharacterized protein BBA_01211 [Beauveria bassiana ARSEF 2860]|uniref:Uncharacterized protein n=1 Tax=Beauveria bassiana (strain ARSEF 2860) TaxID=655819 RepID=J4UVW4_BEAB2|nr:uncharacterized protein BBA_01211 [Beauveria bassiana ARSEF 2860]EJP70342.1 hypothetical protein BBA_01211 [Beauveria bassiana ARSEF 2860]